MVKKIIVDNYIKFLGKIYKRSIVNMIAKDINHINPHIKNEELEHFSNNIYIYVFLIINNENIQNIVDKIMYRNNIFFDKAEKKGLTLSNVSTEEELSLYCDLSDKYIEILREKISFT